jgi:hypothetical protein
LIGQQNSKECAIKARGAVDDISPYSIALPLITMAGKYINLMKHHRCSPLYIERVIGI